MGEGKIIWDTMLEPEDVLRESRDINKEDVSQGATEENCDKIAREKLEIEVELLREENKRLSVHAFELEQQLKELIATSTTVTSTDDLDIIKYSIDEQESFQVGLFRSRGGNCHAFDQRLLSFSYTGIDNDHCFYRQIKRAKHGHLTTKRCWYHQKGTSYDREIDDDKVETVASYDEVRRKMQEEGLLDGYAPSYTTEEEITKIIDYAKEYYLPETKGHQKSIGERKEK